MITDPSVAASDLSQVETSLNRVQDYVERARYRGYEPFDGLSSPLRALTFGNLFAERILQQVVRQSPVNLRPLFGISKKDSTKGRGYMAWGYLYRLRVHPSGGFLTKAEACLDWLDAHKVPRFEHHSWSNHFDFAGRGGMYTRDDPIIVWTSLIGLAYCEAYETTRNERWLRIAESVCEWIKALPRERTSSGDCLSYLAHRQSSIHNANMLGAAMLARGSKLLNRDDLREVARSAMLYSCSRQRDDGSWWYAEEPKYHWIDNFHTGYNLDSLACYIDSTGDREWEGILTAGLAYYKANFFEPTGRPKYYHDRAYPIDSQCAGQSIETLALMCERDPECLPLATRVASWTIENMQERDGHFQYRHYPYGKARTAMLHWGQAVIFKGLSVLAWRLASRALPQGPQA